MAVGGSAIAAGTGSATAATTAIATVTAGEACVGGVGSLGTAAFCTGPVGWLAIGAAVLVVGAEVIEEITTPVAGASPPGKDVQDFNVTWNCWKPVCYPLGREISDTDRGGVPLKDLLKHPNVESVLVQGETVGVKTIDGRVFRLFPVDIGNPEIFAIHAELVGEDDMRFDGCETHAALTYLEMKT